jgi:hypothetical protein
MQQKQASEKSLKISAIWDKLLQKKDNLLHKEILRVPTKIQAFGALFFCCDNAWYNIEQGLIITLFSFCE